MWLLLADLAFAGCGTDPDEGARFAAAPLVAEGTVIALEIEGRRISARVRVDQVHKGEVTTGELLVESGLPNRVDVSPTVYAPGTRLHLIGEPDARGALMQSACTRDVAPHGSLDLTTLAGEGRTFAGAAPARALAQPLLGAGTDERVRVQIDEQTPTALVLQAHQGAVDAELHIHGFRAAMRLPDEVLVPVLAKDTEVGGLTFRAGLRLHEARAQEVGLEGRLDLGETALRWTPSPIPEPTGGSCVEATGPLVLHAERGQQPLVELLFHFDAQLKQLEKKAGWSRLSVHGPHLTGTAWAESKTLGPCGGGMVGGSGGGAWSNTDPIDLELAEGTSLRRPGQEEPFAVADPGGGTVWWLTTHEGRAWVVLPHPGGAEFAVLDCPGSEGRTRCAR